jgi:hypothetical protein
MHSLSYQFSLVRLCALKSQHYYFCLLILVSRDYFFKTDEGSLLFFANPSVYLFKLALFTRHELTRMVAVRPVSIQSFTLVFFNFFFSLQ